MLFTKCNTITRFSQMQYNHALFTKCNTITRFSQNAIQSRDFHKMQYNHALFTKCNIITRFSQNAIQSSAFHKMQYNHTLFTKCNTITCFSQNHTVVIHLNFCSPCDVKKEFSGETCPLCSIINRIYNCTVQHNFLLSNYN
jgi:hypothetical protein